VSFFVSESLKGIISEEDLAANSPIKIIEEEELLVIRFQNSKLKIFEGELIEISLSDKIDNIKIVVKQEELPNVFYFNGKVTDYSICLNGNNHMQRNGMFVLNKIEVNKEDNYVTCKIDIDKRSY